MSATDLSNFSMKDLYRAEAESQTQALTNGLLVLERTPTAADQLEICMRAAHSLKGAARIVDIETGVILAHVMEDVFVAAQQARLTLGRKQIDLLLEGVDLLTNLANTLDLEPGPQTEDRQRTVDDFVTRLKAALVDEPSAPAPAIEPTPKVEPKPQIEQSAPAVLPVPVQSGTATKAVATPASVADTVSGETQDRAIRVTVENLNRLLGLAGEAMVDSRWLKPFGESLLRLKRMHHDTSRAVESLHEATSHLALDERASAALATLTGKLAECQFFLSERLAELEASDRHATSLAHRLYDQALACRMRPFADGLIGFPRMVRDIGRSLGKEVRLEIRGENTPIDRDILEKLDAPLGHLLRNAVDHGLETPDERLAAGKSAEGCISIEAHHAAGTLQIIVSDDGRGIDMASLGRKVVERGLSNAETVSRMSESELLEFLFLPSFTMRDTVTEISGRGVGLDVVQDMVRQVRGVVRVSSQRGIGTRFQLQLPLTLSVVRTLLVEIGGEPYAFPLANIVRTLKLKREDIAMLEGRQHFTFEGQSVGLIAAHQVLDCAAPEVEASELPVVVLGDQQRRFALVVERFIGGRELVVHPLDHRLGKIKDISAGALLEDGSPTLIIDVEDMIRSMERLAHATRLSKVGHSKSDVVSNRRKRILVVDDSLTVRELERKLLDHAGYDVEVSIDGMDGWNAVRAGEFDLVVTDVDMPRMDGIELVGLIKSDPVLKSLPVMIVSYKDREEDRQRGLEAGADYYLAKSSFHDDTLLDAVTDLIGEAVS